MSDRMPRWAKLLRWFFAKPRRFSLLVLLFWAMAAFQIYTLQDLPGLIARHHAGYFSPWAEYISTGWVVAAAILVTIVWILGLRHNRNQAGKVNVS